MPSMMGSSASELALARELVQQRALAEKARRERLWEHRLLWFLLLAIVLLWGYHLIASRVDSKLRYEVLQRLQSRFPRHIVQLDRVHLDQGKSIAIEGLRLSLPTDESAREVVVLQHLRAFGPIDLIGLMQGALPIDRVELDGLEVSLWPLADGGWSLQSLQGQGGEIPSLPDIDVKGGLLRIGGARCQDRPIICHDLKVSVKPATTATPSTARTVPSTYHIDASVSGQHFRQLHAVAVLASSGHAWRIQGKLDELTISDSLVQQLPACLLPWLAQVPGLTCQANAAFQCERPAGGEIDFQLHCAFGNGRYQHPKLPYLFENIRGKIACYKSQIQFQEFSAQTGDTQVRAEGMVHGYQFGVPIQVRATVEQLELNPNFYRALPESARQQLAKFNLAGRVDAQAWIDFDGKRWNPVVVAQCHDLTVHADVFPYPVHHLRGQIEYRDGVILAPRIEARAADRLVLGSLRLEHAKPRWLFDLQLAVEDAVPINETLIAALKPRHETSSALESFVRQLQPGGQVHLVSGRFSRQRENPEVVHRSLELRFHKGQIQYSGFRYPIFGIEGNVLVDNDLILLQRLRGNNDGARIQCQGRCVCVPKTTPALDLEIKAETVPLEEELQRALPPEIRELWDQAQPSGVLDVVDVSLRQRTGQPMELEVRIQEDSQSDPQPAKSLSLQPVALPYYLKDISCEIVYRPGSLAIQKLSGTHDASRVVTEGSFFILPSGWRGSLHWQPRTRLMVDQNLLTSLPSQWRQSLMSLDYRGPVSVTGWTEFASNPQSGQPEPKSWDLGLELEDGRVLGGSVASGIRGSVRMIGENLARGPLTIGHVHLDSLAIRGIPVMNLIGKFSIEEGHVLLGRLADATVLVSPHFQSPDATIVAPASAMLPAATLKADSLSAMSPSNATQSIHSFLSRSHAPKTPTSNRPFGKTPIPSWPAPQSHQGPASQDVPTPSDLRAHSLGGLVFLHGDHQFSTGRMNVALRLRSADFRGLLNEIDQSLPMANGRLDADLDLHGSPLNVNSLSGIGDIRIREADLYELPQMVKLFRLLSVRPPDDGAFETADIHCRIDGEQVWLEEVALDGDVISLRGKGRINFRKEMHLDLYTYVGARGELAKLIAPLLSPENSATLLQIQVDGTPDNLQMRRVIPGFSTTMVQPSNQP